MVFLQYILTKFKNLQFFIFVFRVEIIIFFPQKKTNLALGKHSRVKDF
jgi:hypothetical protein